MRTFEMFFVFLACLCVQASASAAEEPLRFLPNATHNYLTDLKALGHNQPWYCDYLDQPLTRADMSHGFGRPVFSKIIDEIKEFLGFEVPVKDRSATRKEGFKTLKHLKEVYTADQLYSLSEDDWKKLLMEYYEFKCDATVFRPTREDPRLRLMHRVSCNTMCRFCYPNSLPICLTRGIDDEKQTCFCSYDAIFPIENHVLQITN